MADIRVELAFNGNVFGGGGERELVGVLIDHENHLIQQFGFLRCSQVFGDVCQGSLLKHLFSLCTSFMSVELQNEQVHCLFWRSSSRMRRGDKDTETRRAEDSWYFNQVGGLLYKLYLKPSSICSTSLCFHLVWLAGAKGTHTHNTYNLSLPFSTFCL